MAESKDSHIVEIPVDSEHEQKKLLPSISNIVEAIEDHPLTEISDSPGHLLLLKLWQREEEIFGRRIAHKELRMDSVKRDLFQLFSFFFIFHFLFFTLLFTSSVNPSDGGSCGRWWIPSVISAATSAVFIVLVQLKMNAYWRMWREVKREREAGRGLTRCVQELRMKGASFDLSKDPNQNGGKKMKSSSVEIKWKPWSWCYKNSLIICLVCFAGLAVPASKLVLCGF
ncbi:hypothetical protein QN277_018354 [Acacia crassicarpa]|uniref:Uncharacterized protein n=1 Tax=Acacia crassicarpa TaxID=499986 RepID=A0AAE1JVL5_9FABA|nr:hypothetical protein QN277_018354 [Acacia crassicarpa]